MKNQQQKFPGPHRSAASLRSDWSVRELSLFFVIFPQSSLSSTSSAMLLWSLVALLKVGTSTPSKLQLLAASLLSSPLYSLPYLIKQCKRTLSYKYWG